MASGLEQRHVVRLQFDCNDYTDLSQIHVIVPNRRVQKYVGLDL